MRDRRYTLAEIEAMRAALRWIIGAAGTAHYADEFEKQVERELRTALLAGIDPAELARRKAEIP